MPDAPLWVPSVELIERSQTAALMRDVGASSYQELWEWSVADIGRFWRTIWDRFGIEATGDPSPALADARMPGASWFPNVALSFTEHVFAGKDDAALAIIAGGEQRELEEWTWGRLREETARIRAGLVGLGVGRGDRVAGYLPHVPETIAAFLAASSLGATWSCCSPDFGSRTVVDRFAQIEPKVLLACDGYRYNGRSFSRSATVAELEAAMPTLEHTVTLGYLDRAAGDWDRAFPATDQPIEFERVPFDHPLWVLYSSGTTGLPKAIVHSHGGILLEQLKLWHLAQEVTAADRVLWTTTTGWVMWNILLGALLTDAAIVLYDGSLGHPDLGVLWRFIERAGVSVFGTGAAYLHGCMNAGITPERSLDLSRVRAVGSTGSPLSVDGFRWVYEHVGADTWLFSISGGTDIASAFVGGTVLLPVYAGELQCRMLGVDARAFDEHGNDLVEEVGELVITQPMPSMPTEFWNDPGGRRYREAYFEMYPGIWRHGDWIRFTASGSSVIYGRSDSTINRGGVRMGTAEIYAAVRAIPQIQDALIVDLPAREASQDSRLLMFVVLDDGAALTDELRRSVIAKVRADCSPRHAPDEVLVVPAIPRTRTGKICEVPVKNLLMGRDPASVISRDALEDAAALDWFIDYAARSPVA